MARERSMGRGNANDRLKAQNHLRNVMRILLWYWGVGILGIEKFYVAVIIVLFFMRTFVRYWMLNVLYDVHIWVT